MVEGYEEDIPMWLRKTKIFICICVYSQIFMVFSHVYDFYDLSAQSYVLVCQFLGLIFSKLFLPIIIISQSQPDSDFRADRFVAQNGISM